MTHSASLPNTKLLLVDDEPIVLNTLSSGLTNLGYNVASYSSPKEALKIFRDTPFDLVILDYHMPEMNGLDLARAMIGIHHRPVIMLSAYNDLPLVRAAIGAGVSGYLVKPVEAERLAPSIEAALARFLETEALLKQGANLQSGVETQRLISTAVGIVMAKTHRSQDLAFESLRRLARNQRKPLRDIAFELVESTSAISTILSQLSDK